MTPRVNDRESENNPQIIHCIASCQIKTVRIYPPLPFKIEILTFTHIRQAGRLSYVVSRDCRVASLTRNDITVFHSTFYFLSSDFSLLIFILLTRYDSRDTRYEFSYTLPAVRSMLIYLFCIFN